MFMQEFSVALICTGFVVLFFNMAVPVCNVYSDNLIMLSVMDTGCPQDLPPPLLAVAEVDGTHTVRYTVLLPMSVV